MTIGLQPPGGLGRIGVGALAGLGDDDVDDAERVLVGGGHPHRQRPRSAPRPRVRHRIDAQPSGG